MLLGLEMPESTECGLLVPCCCCGGQLDWELFATPPLLECLRTGPLPPLTAAGEEPPARLVCCGGKPRAWLTPPPEDRAPDPLLPPPLP